jgi:RimJ/RimL family protein N-acetyltransferase
MDAAKFSTFELLGDGQTIEIRALRPADRAALLTAMDRSSAQTRYRRFFSPKRGFAESEIAFFLNIDFVTHVALVAVEDGGRGAVVGGGRYVVVRPGEAEVAFVVVDQCQGRGIGALLMRHLALLAVEARLKELSAEVLVENIAMMRVFEKSGLHLDTTRVGDVVQVTLQLL